MTTHTDMTPQDRWAELVRTIDARRVELRLSRTAFLERAGISDRTFRKMAEGIPLASDYKRAGVAVALGWSSDSIERLLRGEEPIVEEVAPRARSPVEEPSREGLDPFKGGRQVSDRVQQFQAIAEAHTHLLGAWEVLRPLGNREDFDRLRDSIATALGRAAMLVSELTQSVTNGEFAVAAHETVGPPREGRPGFSSAKPFPPDETGIDADEYPDV